MRYPKIIITGPFNSGKTELVKTLSEIQVVETEEKIYNKKSLDKASTTVVMDFGRRTIDNDTVVYLFGTPGQERFDFMWEILSKNMVGFMVIIDSTEKDFSPAIKILDFFKEKSDVPFIIVANKQDLGGALPKEEIRKLLGISPDVPIVECVATDKSSADIALKKILELIKI